ncbi:MAG: KEOPS complex N(6)-L-threonylcarbamoyladenine synthase Kae1 [Nitrososphaerota archaeon]|nr:KEOPS complex N(6)-L-threonylcarbamoyladenine synthase Kae1 [Nitrososphaerota archaeon]
MISRISRELPETYHHSIFSKENEGKICLGIESTAHTFGAALTQIVERKGIILSDVKSVYQPPPGSGIHPREASRHHAENAAKVIHEALNKAGVSIKEVDAIAYSAGPGLGPCLRVGAVSARSLSSYFKKPLIPVNHALGHIELSTMLTGAIDPVVLLVTGGHTAITAYISGRWKIFGETLDITIGQLIDQFGREAGFSSPCGAKIEELARRSSNYLPLPYSVKGNDVSFSGILTAAKNMLKEGKKLEDLCYSLQETAFAMLIETTERALAFSEKKEVLLVGGVAANLRLQEMLKEMCRQHDARPLIVPQQYSGDCGAQISWTGLLAYLSGTRVDVEKSIIRQSWRFDRVAVKWRY